MSALVYDPATKISALSYIERAWHDYFFVLEIQARGMNGFCVTRIKNITFYKECMGSLELLSPRNVFFAIHKIKLIFLQYYMQRAKQFRRLLSLQALGVNPATSLKQPPLHNGSWCSFGYLRRFVLFALI